MGFAPKDHPKVAISVIVENGGFGATFAVPIGRLMFQKYLRREVPASDKYIEEHIASSVVLPNMFTNWVKKAVAAEPEVAPTEAGSVEMNDIPVTIESQEQKQ
jgi:penicillin-binding protein 2